MELAAARLYDADAQPCVVALSDACMLLTQCGPALGLLVAQATIHAGAGLRFERAWFLSVYRSRSEFLSLPTTILQSDQGFWVIEDVTTRRFLPEPSALPYSVRYLSSEEQARLESHRERGNARAIFDFAQREYGVLPGFSYERNLLSSPRDTRRREPPSGGSSFWNVTRSECPWACWRSASRSALLRLEISRSSRGSPR